MEQFKISAKVLGGIAMKDFCPRCFWIKMKAARLPWQIFPGIFSSIDAYTKKCVHHTITNTSPMPKWLKSMGDIRGFEKVSRKVSYHDEKNNIILTGEPDDILVCSDGTKVIPDYKTAKFTQTQDQLFPMYEAQVNGYALMHDPKAVLFLVYMEPITSDSAVNYDGFHLNFLPYVLPVKNDRAIVDRLLAIAREIYEMKKAPAARQGCKDCEALNEITRLATH